MEQSTHQATNQAEGRAPWPLAVLALGVFAAGTGGYVFVGVLEPLSADLGVSIELAGQLATVFALTRAVGSPVLVGLTAAVPRRTLLLLALVLFTLAQGLAALATSFAALMAARVLAALGAAVYGPVALATGASLVPTQRRGRALALVGSGLGAAFVLGIPLGTLVGGAYGWRMSFVLAGVLGLVALVAVRLGLPRDKPPVLVRKAGPFATVLRQPQFWLTLAVTTVGFTSALMIVAFVGPLIARLTGSGPVGIGVLQLVIGLGAVMGIALGGQAADRVPVQRALAAVLSLLAIGHLSLSVVPWLPPIDGLAFMATVFALFAGSLAGFALIPLQQLRLLRLVPHAPQLALAANGSAVFAGQGLGAALGGAVIGVFGLDALGASSGAVALCGLLLLILSRADNPNPNPESVS